MRKAGSGASHPEHRAYLVQELLGRLLLRPTPSDAPADGRGDPDGCRRGEHHSGRGQHPDQGLGFQIPLSHQRARRRKEASSSPGGVRFGWCAQKPSGDRCHDGSRLVVFIRPRPELETRSCRFVKKTSALPGNAVLHGKYWQSRSLSTTEEGGSRVKYRRS